MHEILFEYHRINATSWVYVSSLLMIGLYFKFGRFWSVRNLDLVLLILLAPGLLLIKNGREIQTVALSDLSEIHAHEGPPSDEALQPPSDEGLLGDAGQENEASDPRSHVVRTSGHDGVRS